MPTVNIQPANEKVAKILDLHIDEIRKEFKLATCASIGVGDTALVNVCLLDPLRNADSDGPAVDITTVASDTPSREANLKKWRDALHKSWMGLEVSEIIAKLGNVDFFPTLSKGSWGSILKNI